MISRTSLVAARSAAGNSSIACITTGKPIPPRRVAHSAANSSAFPVCDAQSTTIGARSDPILGLDDNASPSVSGSEIREYRPARTPSTHIRFSASKGAVDGKVGTPAVRSASARNAARRPAR